ncbi:MAG TPA: hypothetical protein VE988_02005 [Gemmataceae bacterium]|nr:hypothetical protein [Gemmataceae bacterium]
MFKPFKWTLVVAVALAFLGAIVPTMVSIAKQPGTGQEKKVQPPPDVKKILAEKFDVIGFRAPGLTFKEFLGLVQLRLDAKSKQMWIVVDFKAFANGNPAIDKADINDTKIQFPDPPAIMTLAELLEHALAQIPSKNATYVVMPDHVLITTLAESKSMIDRKK